MADLLKITTPLVSKQINSPIRQAQDPTVPFNIQDLTRVNGTTAQSEINKQNNGMLAQDEPASILLNMLKDPDITMSFLKNIFILEEIIHLLPAKNETVTEEIRLMLDRLLIAPDDIPAELQKQAYASTGFHGYAFDSLRSLLESVLSHPRLSRPENSHIATEMKEAIANLLKAVHANYSRKDIINSLANNFSYLAKALSVSPSLSEKLSQMADKLKQDITGEEFRLLKQRCLDLLKEVENSILYSPKLAQNISIIHYNLSRYNDNPDYIKEAFEQLRQLLDREGLQEYFLDNIEAYLSSMEEKADKSQIMDALSQLVNLAGSDENMKFLNSEKIEKIIQSLLSSPCHFTPLLHFVIPVKHDFVRAFAEMWIDPNGQNADYPDISDQIHILLVIDVQEIGLFEAEIMFANNTVDLNLKCPEKYIQDFSVLSRKLKENMQGNVYKLGNIKIEPFVKLRSLMEVFKSLPTRRLGLDVKA